MTFEEFAAGRLPAVLRFAAVLTGDRAGAEDVVQEVLIRAHRHRDKIGGLDRPELYVRKMIVNEFITSRRRLWRLVPAGRGVDLDDRVTPDHASAHAERQALLAELARLPARQRAVLVLRYYEGLADAETRRSWAARGPRSAAARPARWPRSGSKCPSPGIGPPCHERKANERGCRQSGADRG
jgi:RNA polymerase sigma factor (sigma-70 family)